MKVLAPVALVAILVASASAQAQSLVDLGQSASDSEPQLERLYFARASERGIQVRVASMGCTSEESFSVQAVAQSDGIYLVSLRRLQPDDCNRSRPNGAILNYTREAVGLPADAEVVFANPVRREEF